jgi:hypothetical protein
VSLYIYFLCRSLSGQQGSSSTVDVHAQHMYVRIYTHICIYTHLRTMNTHTHARTRPHTHACKAYRNCIYIVNSNRAIIQIYEPEAHHGYRHCAIKEWGIVWSHHMLVDAGLHYHIIERILPTSRTRKCVCVQLLLQGPCTSEWHAHVVFAHRPTVSFHTCRWKHSTRHHKLHKLYCYERAARVLM